MKYRTNGINLLPKEYVKAARINFYQKVIGAVLAIEVVLFIFKVALPPKYEMQNLQIQLEDAYVRLDDERFNNVNQTIKKLEEAKVDIKNWMDTYGSLKSDNFVSTALLDTLTARLPIGTTLNKVSLVPSTANVGEEVQNATILIEGSSEALAPFMNYLSIIETLYNPTSIQHTCIAEDDHYKFTINIEVPTNSSQLNQSPTENQSDGIAASGEQAEVAQNEEGGN